MATRQNKGNGNRSEFFIESLEDRTLFTGFSASLVAPVPALTMLNPGAETAYPFVRDSSGILYNVDPYGGPNGTGIAYQVDPTTKALTVITTFTVEGVELPMELVGDSGGNLFGFSQASAANGGGLYTGGGTLFELPKSNFAMPIILYQFSALQSSQVPVGSAPSAMIIDSNNNIDVLTGFGGANNGGTVDQFLATESYSTPHVLGSMPTDFHVDGDQLVLAPNGTFYGTTSTGGTSQIGTIWALAPGDTVATTLASFDEVTGGGAAGVLYADAQSNIFGTTSNGNSGKGGAVWEFNNSSQQLSMLAPMDPTKALYPDSGVIADSSGNLFGTTEQGGGFFEVNATTHAVSYATIPSALGTDLFAAPTADGAGNFFVVSVVGAANNHGAVIEISPGGNNGGGGGGGGTGTLSPVIAASTIANSVVAGTKIKAAFTLDITNSGAGVVKGKETVALFASTDGVIDSSSTQVGSVNVSVHLNPGKFAKARISLSTLNVPVGTYTLLAQTTDTANAVSVSSTGPSVAVVAPFVAISAAVGAVKPLIVKAGGAGNFKLTLTNTGNVDSVGLATVTIGLSSDGATVAVPLTPLTRNLKLKVNKPLVLMLHLKIPKGFASGGTFFPIITFTQGSATASAVGLVPFSVV